MSNAVSVHHGEFGRAALYRLDRPIVTHAHREGHLTFYVGGSAGLVNVDGENIDLSETSAAAISPWEPHSFRVPEHGECYCLVLYIKPMWFLENSPSAEFALQFGARGVRVTTRVQQLVMQVTSLLLRGDEADGFDGLLFQLIHGCFEQTWQTRPRDVFLSHSCLAFNDFRVRRSLRLLQEQLSTEVEMETLARQVGLSRPHFFKLFRRQMGVTPNVYLNTLRTEQAIHDLTQTGKTVTDIAHDLSFSSQASFTRFFSSNVGIAPTEYRRVAHVGAFAM